MCLTFLHFAKVSNEMRSIVFWYKYCIKVKFWYHDSCKIFVLSNRMSKQCFFFVSVHQVWVFAWLHRYVSSNNIRQDLKEALWVILQHHRCLCSTKYAAFKRRSAASDKMLMCDESRETGIDKHKRLKVNLRLSLHCAENKDKKKLSFHKKTQQHGRALSGIISLLRIVNHSRNQKFIFRRGKKHEDCELFQSNMCISQHMFTPTLTLPRGASQLAALPETQEESRSIRIQQAASQRSREDCQNSIDKQEVGNMQLWA